MRRVLFVCVENSCRSQVAEGLARALGADALEPHSAGSRPSGTVNPTAIALMRERGIDISRHASKSLQDVPSAGWDYVVTMGCGDACPFVPAKARIDWKIPDPKALPKEEFNRVIDEIEKNVRALVDEARSA
ncbi:MAG: arsenate reductase ArsC [Proteobacteria bacterium]|nr:arsenate reductase ArsC [Pseudomonadota bacterium]